MDITIAEENCMYHGEHLRAGKWTIDASEAEMPPGYWPPTITFENRYGDEETLTRIYLDETGGTYRGTVTLIIWND